MRCSFCKIDVPLPCSTGNVATICVNYQKAGVSSGRDCACPPEDLVCNMPGCPRSKVLVYGSMAVTVKGQDVFDPRETVTPADVEAARVIMEEATLRYNTFRKRLEDGK